MPDNTPLQTFTASKTDRGRELVKFVSARLHISSRKAKALLDARQIWVNGRRIWMARHALAAGDRVEIRIPAPSPPGEPPELTILHRDDGLIAVDKPPGRISDRDPKSVEALLRRQLREPRLRALHRLDRDTSGVLLFTRRPGDREAYIDLFQRHEVEKTYAVLLAGRLPGGETRVDRRLDGKEALTRFSRRAVARGSCRADCRIVTGRTHQIRRHAQTLNCRVLGDTRYRAGPPPGQQEKQLPRQMLHAASIRLSCPHTGMDIEISAPWPRDFQAAARELGLG